MRAHTHLQVLVALQHLLHAARHGVVLVTQDARVEHARGGVERVHGRVDAQLCCAGVWVWGGGCQGGVCVKGGTGMHLWTGWWFEMLCVSSQLDPELTSYPYPQHKHTHDKAAPPIPLTPTCDAARQHGGGVQVGKGGKHPTPTHTHCTPNSTNTPHLPAMPRDSTVVASKWAKVVAGAGSVRSSAGT